MIKLACLLMAIFIMGLSYICFTQAGIEGSSNNSVLAIYFLLLLAVGFFALLAAILGILFSFSATLYSFTVQMTVFVLSNFLLVLVAILHSVLVYAFIVDMFLGKVSLVLNVIVVVLVAAAAPKRTEG